MAQERFANNPSSTLSGAITSSATSLTVASASSFPSDPQFRILIDNEILLVTGVSGNTFTVSRAQEDTTAAAHTNNSVVEGVLSRAGLLNVRGHDVRAYGAVGDGTTDDSTAIQAAIDNLPAGAELHLAPGATYLIETGLNFTSSFHLRGNGATMKAGTDGMTDWIEIDGADDWSIKDVFFDDALKARTIINADTCDGFEISGCRFTGYSAEFGTAATSDSAIKVATCVAGRITNNLFREFGDQYPDSGVDATTLNRGISVLAACNDIVIANNVFKDCNQGIVTSGLTDGGRLVISDNVFTDFRDNALYLVNSTIDTLITGNLFARTDDGDSDEAVVLTSATNTVITGNLFREIPNKQITYDNTCSNVTITGNMFIKNSDVETGGQAITDRSSDATLTNAVIADNIIIGTEYGTTVVGLRGCDNVLIQNNLMVAEFNDVDEEFIEFNGDNDHVVIKDNMFKNTGTGTSTSVYGYRLDHATTATNFLIQGNRYEGCVGRWVLTGATVAIRDEQFNSASNVRTEGIANKVVWGSAAPTSGPFLVGDIVYNTAPTAGGTIGWVCTTAGSPGTWKTFGTIAS